MRNVTLRSCCVILLLTFNIQSLVDVAQEEAKRRKRLDEQGIETKVIDINAPGSDGNGNVTTSTEYSGEPKNTPNHSESRKGQGSVQSYRTTLQKLDRAIQQNELRLVSKRASLKAEKKENAKSGKESTRARAKDRQFQLQSDIEELQLKLKQLRDERLEVYEAGRKAGFMPGELDGKGIVP